MDTNKIAIGHEEKDLSLSCFAFIGENSCAFVDDSFSNYIHGESQP
jgi:hypothetical protein